MDNNINNKRIAKNTTFLYMRMAFALVVSLYTSRVVINTLGVVDYGINNVVAGFVSMFAFFNTSLTASIQRFYNFEHGRNGDEGVIRVFNISIVSQLLLAIIVVLLVETIGIWYLNNKIVIPLDRVYAAHVLFHLTVVSMVALILQIPFSAAVMSHERMDFYAIVGVIDTCLRLVIVFALPYFPYDKLIVYGMLGLLISICDFFFYSKYVHKNFKYLKIRLSLIDLNLFKSVLSFSWWNMFGSFTIVLRGQGLNILINLFFGPIVNAARGVAYSIQSAMMGFIQNISTAARPQLTESYAMGNIKRSVNITHSISKLCFVLLYMMSLPIIGEIDYILHLWLGKAVPAHTEGFVLLVLAISLVDVLNTPISMMMLATGRIKKFNLTASIIGLFSLPICYLVLRCGGTPNSVFLVGLFISIVVQIASVAIMCSQIKVSAFDYIKEIVIPLIVLCIITSGIPYIIHTFLREGFCRLIVTTASSIIVVASISYLIVFSKAEKQLCISFVNSIKNKVRLK